VRGRVAALALLLAGGCEDQSYREIGGEIGILTKRNDALVATATARLKRHGAHALPPIETALHTASETGRGNLIEALHAIGDAEAVPILRHFAVYDTSPALRAACESVLTAWSGGPDARGAAAKAALARVAELRASGEGPAPARPSAI
jgi:hypothetical protein